MATTRPAKKAPAKKAGADVPTKACPPSLIANAVPGNRLGLSRAYGNAAAWLRDGKAPPEELSEWLAPRLDALAQALRDPHNKDLSKIVPHALGLVEKGKRGRKKATPLEERQRRDLVYDVAYQRQRWGGTLAETFDRVVAFHAIAHHYISRDQVEAAWKDRKQLIPEMNP